MERAGYMRYIGTLPPTLLAEAVYGAAMRIALCFICAILCLSSPLAAQSLAIPAPAPIAAPPASPLPTLAASQAAGQPLQATLTQIFATVPQFASINATVETGVVTLTGKVSTPDARKGAQAVAERFEGVVYVMNAIRLETEVESRLEPVLQRFRELYTRGMESLPVLSLAVGVLVLFALLGRVFRRWGWPYSRLTGNPLLRGLMAQAVGLAMVLFGLLLALDLLGLTPFIGAIAGAAGIFGIALGFAFRDVVENYLAGILLSVRSPFSFKDWIEVAGHQGSVVRLTTRELVLLTLENNHIRLPNAQVFKAVIINYTRNPIRGFSVMVGVGVEERLERVQQVGTDALAAMPGVVTDPRPVMRVEQLGDFSVSVRFRAWVNQEHHDFLKVQSEAVRRLKTALDAADVDMPFPVYNLINLPVEAVPAAFLPPAMASARSQREAEVALPVGSLVQTAAAVLPKDEDPVDVERDSFLDEQIAQETATADEPNLLDEYTTRA